MKTLPKIDPPAGAIATFGSSEVIDGVSFTHLYAAAGGLTWHFVSTGSPDLPVALFIHGYPESWFAWHHQMAMLSNDYHCVAVDLPGFGQTEKPDPKAFDYDYAAIAKSLAQLVDILKLTTFNLISHDRGTVIADHLCSVGGMSDRIVKYVRMQQSGCIPHGEPRPSHELFRSQEAVEAFSDPANVVQDAYVRNPIVAFSPNQSDLDRMAIELGFDGVAGGAAASFKSADFDKEHADRVDGLFASMTMPILFLQGALDLGQSPAEYEAVTESVSNGTLQFINAGHFLHLERPRSVGEAVFAFLKYIPSGDQKSPD